MSNYNFNKFSKLKSRVKPLKINKKLACAKFVISLSVLAIILSGCSQTVAQIVKIDSFCGGKYESIRLTQKDGVNITNMRMNQSYIDTIDKLIDHTAIHEREFENCPLENE